MMYDFFNFIIHVYNNKNTTAELLEGKILCVKFYIREI